MSKAFDVNQIRQDFPILQQMVNEKPLIYFDNAATSQKPQAVIDAITSYYCNDNANIHRGLHALSERATEQYEDARENVRRFINAKSASECIFVRGTTEAINLVAHSFVMPRIQPDEAILITEMEHHSNIVPWQILGQHTGANLRYVPISDEGEVDLKQFEAMLTPDVKVFAVTHISNSLGTVNPIKDMIRIAHDHDVIVIIDGAQAAPHTPIDVQDLDCDFYMFSSHKMYGPTGVGVLYGKHELLDRMTPYQSGGDMILQVTFNKTEFNATPHKFEAGTPHIAGAIALSAAIDYINNVGLDNIAAYEHELLTYATDKLKQVKGVGLIGTAKEKASILSFVLQNVHAHDLGTILNSMGIAVRAGHHCTMPVMDKFQVPATTRASFAFYNTKQEIDVFIEAVAEAVRVMG